MIKKIKFGQKNYPQLLAKIKDPPETLYYQTDWDNSIFKNCLAVVGTRRMSDYGEEMVERLVGPVAQAGITIVSGFMYGIDAQAHQVCLENNGQTIAVLGCGIDLIRPVSHRDLHEKIIENHGLILSELPGEHPPARWTFVRRNRIISGLSQAVLVIEAGKGSGALITAGLARQQKRKVLAVPGPATSGVSWGTAQLIKDGAQLITDPGEILTIFGLSSSPPTQASQPDLNKEQEQIWQMLADRRLSIDELARELQQSAAQVGTKLSLMVLKGLLKEDKQGRYYK